MVNPNAAMAELLDEKALAVGSAVEFSSATISDSKGNSEFIMCNGTLMGYDEFGGQPHIIVERDTDLGVPDGRPRVICLNALRKLADAVRIPPTTVL